MLGKLSFLKLVLAALFGMSFYGLAAAAGTQYEQDLEYCKNTPGIDVQACIREAQAAAQDAKSKRFLILSDDIERTNRVNRCQGLPESERQACIDLMEQESTTKGSVQGGGVLRTRVYTVPAP